MDHSRGARQLRSRASCGTLLPMGKPALDVGQLSRDEQMQLLDELWGVLGRDPEALPLSDEQRVELDRRLDDLDVEGPVGLTWDEVVAQARAARG